MRIFFDYKIFFHQKVGGISRYIINLHKKLLEKNISSIIYAPIHINKFLNDLNCKENFYLKKEIIYSSRIINLYNSIKTFFYIKKYKPSIIHTSYYNSELLDQKSALVVTVYDLIHELIYKNKNGFKKKILDRADHVICISKNTLDDLVKIYNINVKKTSVIYLGINYLNLQKKYNFKIEYPYILYVGDRRKYKNFKLLIDIYSISKILSKSFKIVCFGGGKFTKEEDSYFRNKKIDLNSLIHIEGGDEILINLYSKARALIITSLYEGFGMTALEAQYLNCPVLSSHTKVSHEILKESAIFFNSTNIDDAKSILEKYLFSDSELRLIKKRGYENSTKFTLEKNAQETISVYKKLI
jgi:glycosyltransferase involved in cell wall biosynthesis